MIQLDEVQPVRLHYPISHLTICNIQARSKGFIGNSLSAHSFFDVICCIHEGKSNEKLIHRQVKRKINPERCVFTTK